MTAHNKPAAGNPWLFVPRPILEPRARLLCFPYAGGNATGYRSWARKLPPDVELCAVQLPGRRGRLGDPPFTRMSLLVDALEVALGPCTAAPFALFGHSMGALIAYELACRLRDRGGPAPTHLFLSGRRAPELPSSAPPAANLPEAEFIERVRAYAGIPDEIFQHAELMSLLLPVLRADFALIESWRDAGHAPLDVPFSVFGGLDDVSADRERIEGWRARTRGDFALHILPGNHFFITSAEDALLQIIARALA